MAKQTLVNPFAGLKTPAQAKAGTQESLTKIIKQFGGDRPTTRLAAQAGAQIGLAAARFINGGTKEERQAQANQKIMDDASASVGNKTFATEEERTEEVLHNAIRSARAAGLTEQASVLAGNLSQVQDRIAEKEVEQAKLLDTKSQTSKRDIEIERLNKTDPSKDPLTRSQNRTDVYRDKFANASDPGERDRWHKRLAQEEENTQRILKGKTTTEDVTKLTKPSTTKLEETLINQTNIIDNIDASLELYDPEAFTLKGKGNRAIYRAKDFLGMDLSDEERETLIDQTQLMATISTNSNATIKMLSGAAVSAQEKKRVDMQVIKLDGKFADTPAQVEAKLHMQSLMVRAQRARSLAGAAANNEGGEGAALGVLTSSLTPWMEQVAEEEGLDMRGFPLEQEEEVEEGELDASAGTVNFTFDDSGNINTE